jgi:hypothetical protein
VLFIKKSQCIDSGNGSKLETDSVHSVQDQENLRSTEK